MADIVDKQKRSEIMRLVRSRGNKSTEIRMIKLLRDNSIKGWRRNYNVTGHPDFVFLKERIAVFVDGCFWHGHNCRNTTPANHECYWEQKAAYNREHDTQITMQFEQRGWAVLRIWECELKKKNQAETIRKFLR